MSEPTNSTTDPFASSTTDAHGSLYKAIGLSLAIGSSTYDMHDYYWVIDVLRWCHRSIYRQQFRIQEKGVVTIDG